MNHFTNFFTKLKEYFKDVDVTFRIKEKNDRYTVIVIPEIANANGLKPLSITGTAKELDDDFFGKLQEAVGIWQGIAHNIEEVKKDASDIAAAAAQKKEVKPGNKASKGKPAKGKPAKGKPEGKTPKKPAGPAGPAGPEQRDIFSQAPPEGPAGDPDEIEGADDKVNESEMGEVPDHAADQEEPLTDENESE